MSSGGQATQVAIGGAQRLEGLVEAEYGDVVGLGDHAAIGKAAAHLDQRLAHPVHGLLVDPEVVLFVEPGPALSEFEHSLERLALVIRYRLARRGHGRLALTSQADAVRLDVARGREEHAHEREDGGRIFRPARERHLHEVVAAPPPRLEVVVQRVEERPGLWRVTQRGESVSLREGVLHRGRLGGDGGDASEGSIGLEAHVRQTQHETRAGRLIEAEVLLAEGDELALVELKRAVDRPRPDDIGAQSVEVGEQLFVGGLFAVEGGVAFEHRLDLGQPDALPAIETLPAGGSSSLTSSS